jgi:molybdate transport system substrate-binding protein
MHKVLKACALLLLCSCVHSEPIHIAVASNFKTTLQEIANAYSLETGVEVQSSSASTGVLAAQIIQGAPFDLLLAADSKTPETLKSKLNIAQTPTVYAIGQLVFWCPKGAPSSQQALSQWQGKYALADSKHAPYGAAAQSVVEFLNWGKTNKPITASNIAQVTHFVGSGAIACGFAAKSLIPKSTSPLELFEIPKQWYAPIKQSALILNTKQPDEVKHLLSFLLIEGQPYLKAAGYL